MKLSEMLIRMYMGLIFASQPLLGSFPNSCCRMVIKYTLSPSLPPPHKKSRLKYTHILSTIDISVCPKRAMILFCLISSTSNPFSARRPTPPMPSQRHFDDSLAVESLPMPPSAPREPHSHRIPETFVRRTQSRL